MQKYSTDVFSGKLQMKLMIFLSLFLPASICLAQDSPVMLRIPEGTKVVKVFDESIPSLEKEYQLKSIVYFISGDYNLPQDSGKYPLELIDYIEFGPDHLKGIPRKNGSVLVDKSSPDWISYTLEETIDIGTQVMQLKIDYLGTQLENGKPVVKEFVFNEPFLTKSLFMIGTMTIDGNEQYLRFASEKYESLPLYLFDVTLENGQAIQLYVRWQEPMAGSGPANLVYATGSIQEGSFRQDNYWKLVYSAVHHNWDEKFWVLFDQPIGGAYGIAIFTRNVFSEEPQEVYTLDANLKPLRKIPLVKIEKKTTDVIPYPSVVTGWEMY